MQGLSHQDPTTFFASNNKKKNNYMLKNLVQFLFY